ncbi:protein-lysine N-methyltransferase [Sporobolomyces koalae]|uniref:protein-lysine N-methyltransferase n=1 Tax=Sporobolomyces koalae TaxID=500713 RepID=UPI0031777E8E
MSRSSEFDPIWTWLLEWLSTFDGSVDVEKNIQVVHNAAGRGLVARSNLPPSTLLISIPNQALLNLHTLSPLYPPSFTSGNLNATQLLSLHLAIQFRKHLFLPRSNSGKGKGKEQPTPSSLRDKFWPFLATLPRSFPSHPLTWILASKSYAQLASSYSLDLEGDIGFKHKKEHTTRIRSKFGKLVDCMGSGLRTKVEAVEARFSKDWKAVQAVWQEHKLEDDEEFGFFDFVLGWLNVNTRCIYFDLPTTSSSPAHYSKKENSLTLAPVIDMINHAPSLSTKPHPTPTALTFSSPSRSSTDKKVFKGDELAFSYGGHDDSFLLSEYGFIIGNAGQDPTEESKQGNEYNSLNVDKYVEALFENQKEEGQLKIGILRDVDYWSDMTFQSQPPSPSWRVLIALRLLHLRLPSHSSLSLSAEALAPFYDLLSGSIDQISHLNEKKVQSTIKAIAKNLVIECRQGLDQCQKVEEQWVKDKKDDEDAEMIEWLSMVRGVWQGEEQIARALAE